MNAKRNLIEIKNLLLCATALLPTFWSGDVAAQAATLNVLASFNNSNGATANILVNVYSTGPPQVGIQSKGAVSLICFGFPNYNFVLQTSTNISGPWWPLCTNSASSDGSCLFTDPNATNAQQYYRMTVPE